MKMKTTLTASALNRWMSILAVTIALSLTVPVVGFTQPPPQEPISLGASGGFVVLAASLISSIPTSAIEGNVGLSPAAGSEITGLTSDEVDGFIYTVDETGPAGSIMDAELLTAAQGDLTTAYNDAAARTPVPEGDFLNPGSGDIGGMTLVSGLYKFTNSASITEEDLTLTGGDTEVWIFQIASDLNVGSGISVILSGGARAANIFWQVSTSATLGTTSNFKGTILADQSISLATNATVEGRLLARIAAITLDAVEVTHPGESSSSIQDGWIIPNEIVLLNNYPNPFNSSTGIEFAFSQRSHITVSIFSLLGKHVATLVNRDLDAGSYSTTWDAGSFSSGIYFVQLNGINFSETRRMLLVR